MATNEYKSPIAIHPGESLREILEDENISQKSLATRTGLTPETISRIINGKLPITQETALKLERVLGVSRDYWMNFQNKYDSTLARIEETKRLEEEVSMLEKFTCYTELAKMGFVETTRNKVEKVKELLRFYGVDSLKLVQTANQVAYRKSSKMKINPESLTAWLRMGEIQSKEIEVEEFDPKKLKEKIPEMRALTNQRAEVFSEKLKEICAECGVILVYTPNLKNVPVNGATRRIFQGKPLIQMSLRNSYSDIFWFTFFHEIGHLQLHGKKDFFIDMEGQKESEIEKEADNFSQEVLIPKKQFTSFMEERGYLNKNSILRFAEQINIHPGIIAGRIARETGDWRKYSPLRSRLKFVK